MAASRWMTTRRGVLGLGAAASVSACLPRSGGRDGALRVAIDSEPDSLDPLKGQFASAALLFKQLHAPLTEYSPSGGLAPGLAQTWRSEDARTWRFTLRDGLVWSDGTALTADDVVWTAQRLLDPTTGFAQQGDFFAVINARAALRGEVPPEAVGVTALDERRVEFRLDRPVAIFPVLMREFYPLPRHAVSADPDDWIQPENWVCAGPYLLQSRSGLSLSLRRNPYFAAAESVSIETIAVDIIEDTAARARRFRAGDYDLVDRPASDQIGFLRERLGDQLAAFPAPILAYLKVNCAKPHLSDPRVRRALSLGVDRQRINTLFFAGEASPTTHIIPDPDASAPERNIAEAVRLLAQAGYGPENPLEITLRATAGDRDRIAVSIMDDWAQLGVQTRLLSSYPLDLYQAVDGGDFDLALARFDRGLKTDPEFMIQPFTQDGFADNTRWEGPRRSAFDAQIDAASALLDGAERLTALREAEAILLEDMPNIPLVHERAYWMVGSRVELNPAIPPHLWRDLALD
jgi:oligopeptide transport system substrate-binding protein